MKSPQLVFMQYIDEQGNSILTFHIEGRSLFNLNGLRAEGW